LRARECKPGGSATPNPARKGSDSFPLPATTLCTVLSRQLYREPSPAPVISLAPATAAHVTVVDCSTRGTQHATHTAREAGWVSKWGGEQRG
jgi:hypothetical protein